VKLCDIVVRDAIVTSLGSNKRDEVVAPAALRCSCQRQHLAGKTIEHVDLFADPCQPSGRVPGLALEQLDGDRKPGERRAQLVGNVAKQLLARPGLRLEFGCHPVELPGDLADLVAAVGLAADARRKIAGREARDRIGNAPRRARQRARQEPETQEARDRRHRQYDPAPPAAGERAEARQQRRPGYREQPRAVRRFENRHEAMAAPRRLDIVMPARVPVHGGPDAVEAALERRRYPAVQEFVAPLVDDVDCLPGREIAAVGEPVAQAGDAAPGEHIAQERIRLARIDERQRVALVRQPKAREDADRQDQHGRQPERAEQLEKEARHRHQATVRR